MKAYKIDTVKREITQVEYHGDFREIYKHIEADCFDMLRISARDHIFVSDNGLIDGTAHRLGMFEVEGYPQPLAGHGLVLGTNAQGDSIAPVISLDELRAKITFLTAQEAVKKYG